MSEPSGDQDPADYSSAGLLVYVGAKLGQEGVDEFADQCWDEADALVTAYISEANLDAVPEEIIGRATLEVGAELFHRKNTKNGLSQFATADGQAVRIARDPMVAAYPLLNRYLPGGFA